jgi:cation diffusion facilitator family transporter
MIFFAAGVIVWTALRRLVDPQPVEQAGLGLAIIAVATLLNLGVGLVLIRAGRTHRSITLEADGKHLLTDVWTSVGVLVGVGLVAVTGFDRLDPVVALAVGVNILVTGWGLVRRSGAGLLDASLPPADREAVEAVVAAYRARGIDFHALRSRESGQYRFVYVHVLVPGDWTVVQGHDLCEQIERDIALALPGTTTFTHLEPAGDPSSYADEQLGDARFRA